MNRFPLCDLVLPQTNPEIQERGESCCERVLKIVRTVYGWQAEVLGEDEPQYEVNFYLGTGGECSVECSCGHFEIHNEICKHIVAVARVIDQSQEDILIDKLAEIKQPI